jgi:hypothetical protein
MPLVLWSEGRYSSFRYYCSGWSHWEKFCSWLAYSSRSAASWGHSFPDSTILHKDESSDRSQDIGWRCHCQMLLDAEKIETSMLSTEYGVLKPLVPPECCWLRPRISALSENASSFLSTFLKYRYRLQFVLLIPPATTSCFKIFVSFNLGHMSHQDSQRALLCCICSSTSPKYRCPNCMLR